jgi:hypothetical protein
MPSALSLGFAAGCSLAMLWLISSVAAGNAAAEPPLVRTDPRPVKVTAEPPAEPPALVEVPHRGCPEWTICPSPPKPPVGE